MPAVDRSELHGADIVDSILLIPIDQIEVGERLRAVDPVHAQALGLAMARDGQKVSIQVCRLPGATKWRLVDGAHRHAGAEMAGIVYLRAEVTSANREERRLREIWAQLGHKGLSDPIDRAAFIAELVQIKRASAGLADAQHRDASVPTAKRAIDAEADLTLDTMSNVYGWSDEVGEQLGFTGRTIRRDLLIFRGIAPSLIARLRDARHPVARNATQLRALANVVDPERQRLVVDALLAGSRSVTEAMTAGTNKPAPDDGAKLLSRFLGTWHRMSLPERKGALAHLADLLPAGFQLLPPAHRDDALAAIDHARDVVDGIIEDCVLPTEQHVELREAGRGLERAGLTIAGKGVELVEGARPARVAASVASEEVKQAINDAFTFFQELDKWDPDASIGMVGDELRKARGSIQLACFAVNAESRA